jgi:hypothetical protein
MNLLIAESHFSGTMFRKSRGKKWLIHPDYTPGTEHDLEEMIQHYWNSELYKPQDTYVYGMPASDDVVVSFVSPLSEREGHRLTIACNDQDERQQVIAVIASWFPA